MNIGTLVEKSAGTRSISCLLKDVDGLKSISFNTVNLQNTGTLVFVDLLKEDGKEYRVFCSKPVSAGVRSKAITREMLLGFPVVEYTDEEGRTGHYIQMPDGASHKVTFDVSTLTAKQYVPEVVDWTALIG